MNPSILRSLASVVGTSNVLTDADLRVSYEVDWTRRWHGEASAVVRPADVDETAAVVTICSRAGISVVPQGGNTGLVGGAVPRDGAVLLSLTRLQSFGDFDTVIGEVSVGAGMTLGNLQTVAKPYHLEPAIDLGARDSATIGGMIATNAGGTRVLRYGAMAHQIVGLEAVLADGSRVTRMPGLRKDSCGYDLVSAFAGSEGTLGVITRARVRLVPIPQWSFTALVGLPGIAHALELLQSALRETDCLVSAEFLTSEVMDLVCHHLTRSNPVQRSATYLLLEWAAPSSRLAELSVILNKVGQSTIAVEEGRDISGLWQFRDRITEAIAAEGVPKKLDVALPLRNLSEFMAQLDALVGKTSTPVRHMTFGHLAEGNLHVNLLGVAPSDLGPETRVLELIVGLGGSISSEHGVGSAKVGWLHLARTADEVQLLRRIKSAFDPEGVLNPGVILD